MVGVGRVGGDGGWRVGQRMRGGQRWSGSGLGVVDERKRWWRSLRWAYGRVRRARRRLARSAGRLGGGEFCGRVTGSGFGAFLTGFGFKRIESESVGDAERTRRREDQLLGAARERLLRALPGTMEASGRKEDGFCAVRLPAEDGIEMERVSDEDEFEPETKFEPALTPEMSWSFRRSSLENDSSTKLESHSSSANSSYCKRKR
ncbi:uncharacterized protein A4U43_C05F26330 [Asparagus officinalis]|uniref:Uncharacterized protein n=1 Tax=Asparagus officinalis TaxID=4686 RepID=A0A5P1F008_ASPOF|nr:uncharacterized protein A4U43_C05F26330 [Asparagus officinalis]